MCVISSSYTGVLKISLFSFSLFIFVWQPTSENKIFNVVLPSARLSFLHPLCHISFTHIYKCAPTHASYLKDTHTHVHDHRGENQANRPHEFLLK